MAPSSSAENSLPKQINTRSTEPHEPTDAEVDSILTVQGCQGSSPSVGGRQAHRLPYIRCCLQRSPSRWEQQPLCMGLIIIDLVGMHCIGFMFGTCE